MRIKMLVMDVDGTLTDGRIYTSATGEVMKAFDVKDGYGIVSLHKQGVVPVIITGRQSDIVKYRAKELGIVEIHQGINNKLEKLKELSKKYGCISDEIAYIGDDLNDIDCIQYCGVSGCPSDAVEEVKNVVEYICESKGGKGAVREFAIYLLKNKK